MVAELLIIISCIAIVFVLFGTEVGKRILLRIKGTAKEAIDKDASTQAGAAAHYQNAIDKKEEEYRNAYHAHAQLLGEISSYEKELREYRKSSMQIDININTCINNTDDEGAKAYLVRQQNINDKIDILKDTVTTLKENAIVQKENVDSLLEQLNELKVEKEKSLLILKTSESTKTSKISPCISSNEEDKMLEKVREGIRKKQKEADGLKIAYENSAEVQQQRLDKKMQDNAIEQKLQELKAKRNTN